MNLFVALLATAGYAVDEWVANRRLVAVTSGTRKSRVFWCVAYAAILAGGMVLLIESRWYAIPLIVGAGIGAWLPPK